MSELPVPRDDEAVGELFDEYLEGWVNGAPPDLEELELRAGPRAAELRGRVALVGELGDLQELLQEENAAPAPQLERVAHFEIVHKIGESASSRVFRALDTRLHRDVALKVLKGDALEPGEAIAWVRNEGRSLARMKHPSVVHVYEAEVAEGIAFLAMELVDGPSLHDVLGALRAREAGEEASALKASAVRTAERLQPLAQRCRLVLALARALAACHEIGIVHRDVKPGNVLLDRDAVPKLIDFGLAHVDGNESSLHHTRNLYGTLPYLAPEQVEHERTGASPLTDQYALGLVLYELVTLRHPFVRENIPATWRAVAHAEIVPPRALRREVPTDLERICLHCLEREPSNRYATMKELALDLEAFLEHRAISLPEPALAPRVWKAIRRHRMRAAAIAAGALIGLLGLFGLAIGRAERSHLLDGLRTRQTTALDKKDPETFAAFFADALRAREAAPDYDGALLAGSLLPRVGDELESMYAEASQALHDSLAKAYGIEPESGWGRANDDAARSVREEWFGATWLEKRASPTGRCRGFGHEIGTVALPEDAKLFRYDGTTFPQFPRLLEVSADEPLRMGLYRCVFGSGATRSEREFLGSPFRPRFELSPESVPVEIAARTVPCREQLLVLPSQTVPSYAVGPLRMLGQPVSYRELALALGEKAAQIARSRIASRFSMETDSISPNSPAIVDWMTAQRCATKLGGRIPTAAELWAALREHEVQRDPDLASEWVSGCWDETPENTFRLELETSLVSEAEKIILGDALRDGTVMNNGFRLVYPAGD